MKLPRNGEPTYSGKLSTGGFQLGTFLNNRDLGVVDFHGRIRGSSFNWNKLDMNIDGMIHRFHYGNYTYQNITAKGNLSNRRFNGAFVIKDPNADINLNGLIDLTGDLPFFDARATIARINLKALNLGKEDIELSGVFDVNLRGNSLSNLLGKARITSVSLFHKGRELAFDSLVVSSGYKDGLRTLDLRSNEFNATINGNFDLAALPQSIFRMSRYREAGTWTSCC
jgi:hypothetical protein